VYFARDSYRDLQENHLGPPNIKIAGAYVPCLLGCSCVGSSQQFNIDFWGGHWLPQLINFDGEGAGSSVAVLAPSAVSVCLSWVP